MSKYYQIDVVAKTTRNPLGYIPFILKSIFKILTSNYDLIHAHYVPHSALIPALLKRIIKKPLIVTFHGDDARIFPWKNRLYRWLTSFVVRMSDAVIVRSEEMKEQIKRLGIRAKIVVICAGVDVKKFKPIPKHLARKRLGLPSDNKIVIYIGRLDKMKGVELIYRCAELLNALFVFIGEGELKVDRNNCIFASKRTHDEIPIWLSASDVLVLPSYSEGLPNVVMEALSCGIPAVVSNAGGCPEVVECGKTGFVVPVGDTKSLAKAIEKLLYDENLRLKMGLEGRKKMIKRFEVKKMIKRLRKVYESCLRE